MARNIAGDRLTVKSITKLGAEIHGYQPTPSDLVKASKADLIVENGLGLELWAKKFTVEYSVGTYRVRLTKDIRETECVMIKEVLCARVSHSGRGACGPSR